MPIKLGLRVGGKVTNRIKMWLPLLTGLNFLKGVGTPSFTRNSAQYLLDFENRMVKANANAPALSGMRLAEGLEEGAALGSNKVPSPTNPALWTPVTASIAATGETVAGLPKLSVISGGATWHRANCITSTDGTSAVSGGQQIYATFKYIAGTSGKILINFRDDTSGNEAQVQGTIGGNLSVFGVSPQPVVLSDVAHGEYREIKVVYFPPKTCLNIRVGIGPYSAVAGENIFVLDSYVYECQSVWKATTPDTTLSCWGDSLTAASYPTVLSYLQTQPTYNGGIGGETSTQIKTRFLAAQAAYKAAVVIWAGRNNYSSTSTVLADIAAMVAAVPSGNFLVLSVLNGEYATEYIGQAGYDQIKAINDSLAATYGGKYVDVRAALVSSYNPAIPQDVIDFSHDIPPSSKRVDAVHLGSNGYQIVAALVSAKISELFSGVKSTTLITTGTGLLIEPATTNKCTCYGVPRADSYGSTLASGTATKGKVYEIVTRTSIDWGAVGTLLSGTTNTAGAKYVITGSLTFTANDTGKEAIDYVGTKAYHDGTAFQNPITGMTLSGDTAAVLSIVTDQTAIDAAKLGGVVNGYKFYDLTTGSGGAGNVDFAGAMSAVIMSMSIIYRVVSGSATIGDSAGANTLAISGAIFSRAKKENFTATAARTMRLTAAASSRVIFGVPVVEELPFTTSITPSAGATATRAATVASIPMAGNFPTSGVRHIRLEWTPTGITTNQCLWSSRYDANNYTAVWANPTGVSLEKKVAGVSEYVTFPLLPALLSTYKIDAFTYTNNTLGLKVDEVDYSVAEAILCGVI